MTAFVLQAVVRGFLLDTAILGALATMTGVAFVLFTNYMITDPGTSPSHPVGQVLFGAGTAVVYGCLTGAGISYGLFFALVLVCLIRGCILWGLHFASAGPGAADAAVPAADRADRKQTVPA